jgi:flagellar biosynthesis protein FlhG
LLDRGVDQAHGLRRMFAAGRPCVLHVIAGAAGVGRTTVAVNLAAALARSGRDTLLIEAVAEPGLAHAFPRLGLEAPRAAAGAAAIAVPGTEGLALWPLVLGAHEARPAITIPDRLPGRTRLPDVVLLTGAGARPLVWTGEHERQDVLVVLSRAPASITQAYALVKRMSASGMRRRYHVLVNRVGSHAEAERIYRNMAAVAQGYLDVDLCLSGFIPADDAVAHAAASGASVLDLAPGAPAAQAFRRIAELVAAPAGARPAPPGKPSPATYAYL